MRHAHSMLALWRTPADRGAESSGVGGAGPSYHIQKAELGRSSGVSGAWLPYHVQEGEIRERSGVGRAYHPTMSGRGRSERAQVWAEHGHPTTSRRGRSEWVQDWSSPQIHTSSESIQACPCHDDPAVPVLPAKTRAGKLQRKVRDPECAQHVTYNV